MSRAHRAGLTLIELLVVISIIIVVMALVAVYVVPAFQDNKNVQRGTDRIVTTLLIAKQRALRDQRPVGVRFERDSDGLCRRMRYVEQPDLVSGWKAILRTNDVNVTLNDIDLLGGFPTTGIEEDKVALRGDWLRVGGVNYEIAANPTSATAVTVTTAPQTATINGRFQIIRQTRPIGGEEVVELPLNVAIDFGSMEALGYSNNQVPNQSTRPEIVFSPATGVFNRGTAATIALWVRDETLPATDLNTARVISIVPRTGQIGSFPLSTTAGNPLEYALDGKSSGL